MTQEMGRAQADYGFTHLGPIVAAFLHDLDAVLERLISQRAGRALFVARGGLLIQRALNVYRSAIGSRPRPAETPFYVSRFMAAKGAWLRTPERALVVFNREFRAATGADYLRRLEPHADDGLVDGERYASFSDFLGEDGPLQDRCRAHLARQAELFERYFSEATDGRSLIALIDTGWQGTIQSLLAHTYPTHEFWGVNFGRQGEVDTAISPRLLGLGFQGDYDPTKPLSAVAHHRHLIEALFEPIGASVENMEEKDGKVRPVGIEAFTGPEPRPGEPDLYGGVLRYLREAAPGLSYSELLKERDNAARKLADDILYPSTQTARLLGGFTRSIDFGRRDGVPVLLDSSAVPGSPEDRIRASLWKQGQIALECRPAIARERQRSLTPQPNGARASAQAPANPVAPKVAIIMRTKDRLLFLQRALEGIARQTFQDYVLVVFNDGGDVEGVAAELEISRVDRRKVILLDGGENRGMEAASNAAISHVDSQYIVIHDDDDSWLIHFLEKTVAFLETNPKTIGVVTRSFYVEDEICGDNVEIKGKSYYNPWLRAVQLGELLAGNFYPPISFLFRRSHYEAVGGFDESLPVLGDWHFNIRMAALGEIAVIPETLANYHHRSASGSYANSIVGGSDLHARYNPVVRHKILQLEQQPAIAGASLLSSLVAETRALARSRHEMQALTSSSMPVPTNTSLAMAADLRWCMLEYARAHPECARDMTVQDALKFAEDHGVSTPPDFDEDAYLAENPDVRELVRAERAASGFAHFILDGRREGRRRPTQ